MSEKVNLKVMRCPTCGANLKAENGNDTITCLYCGNTIVPVAASAEASKESASVNLNGKFKIEGLKSPSSALAYLDIFFEEYDWESFSYAQSLSISEIDILAASLKSSSADDKNTWFVCFKAIFLPLFFNYFMC